MPLHSKLRLIALIAIAWTLSVAKADDPPRTDSGGGHGYNPHVVSASPDAAKAMKSFRVPDGMNVDLWAAEPLLANPVVFGFDEKGRIYVVETFRLHHGVTDLRGHMDWLDDDLASRSVEDRVAKYKKHLPRKEFESWGVEHDRIRIVEDRDGDGKADHANVFADGFNKIPDGIAAGVLAHHGDIYFTCIPNLWLLRDTNNDGKADVQKSLGQGYGVHTGFLGHDLHGLKIGPDGKLYFSIGDRGLNVKTADRTLFNPDSGAVMRCNLDGSELELFCTGLRNPQELAFDEYGNLFTVDNNSDSGDKARLVYLLEGSDSGWTMGWQYIERPTSRGPWNAEKLWYPKFPGQAADIVPPLANISDGPSGLVYHPGVARLPRKYERHFFLADFRGSAGSSGIRAFSVKPDGAGFQLDQSEQMFWGVLATDVDFGPDGAMYVSDWVEGWNTTGKGRIYKLFDQSATDASAANEVKTLLGAGFVGRSLPDLVALLAHADQRIRQEAQFALAVHGLEASKILSETASNHSSPLARLHAIWCLGQIARKSPDALRRLEPLLADKDAEVRAQVSRTLGDLRDKNAARVVSDLLRDDSPRVRSLAAIALGKIGRAEDVKPLLAMLAANGDTDPFLRHAGVMGLAGIGSLNELRAAIKDPSSAARLGGLLALRRLKSAEIAGFLNDADQQIVTEAARAIYDGSIDSALPELAALGDRGRLSLPAWRRVVNANARIGQDSTAQTLARLANRSDLPIEIRVEALELLAAWAKPPGRDGVTGLWRPRKPQPATVAAAAIGKVLIDLLRAPEKVLVAALRAAGPLPLADHSAVFAELLADKRRPATTRVEALHALHRLGDRRLPAAISSSLNDSQPMVRIEAQRLLARLDPDQALPLLSVALDHGSIVEKQAVFASLAAMKGKQVDSLLNHWLDVRDAGELPPEIELDLLEAAARRNSDTLTTRLRASESALPKNNALAGYRVALVGGNAERGEKILQEKAEVQCIRCHKVRGKGGEVGPELTGIGSRQDRSYLLESIVEPNKQIAKGFETLLISTTDGQVQSGILKEETGKELRLLTAEGKPLVIRKDDIEDQKRGNSAMPEDLIKHLSKSDVRDLVEYLSTLK